MLLQFHRKTRQSGDQPANPEFPSRFARFNVFILFFSSLTSSFALKDRPKFVDSPSNYFDLSAKQHTLALFDCVEIPPLSPTLAHAIAMTDLSRLTLGAGEMLSIVPSSSNPQTITVESELVVGTYNTRSMTAGDVTRLTSKLFIISRLLSQII